MPARRKIEYVSLAGLRLDGRKPADSRELEIELGVRNDGADGSAYVSAGGTRVVAAVYGPREIIGIREDSCSISVDCVYAAYSSATGQRREHTMKAQEAADIIKGVLSDVIMRSSFPSSVIQIHLEVLSDDGSVIPTLLNAASAALVSAAIPVIDLFVACSASLLQGHSLVDVTDQESRGTGPYLTLCVLPSSESIAMMTHDYQLEVGQLESLTADVIKACKKIHAQVRQKVVANAEVQFQTRAKEK
eukprot:TRINITY_DN559_c0_g1_i1.p1 TRINITY_DN559_c0_g1~~TRINITY_DN559_c0_g1_i1.p1  ORF type:complete len:247 (+),score=36.39 TRINITY_DN559_c0_g1_i1:111-851(+)